MTRKFLCSAEGHKDQWQAICLDLDIAVQGRSLADVQESLGEAIDLYVEAANAENEHQREKLLNRRTPFGVRLSIALRSFVHFLFRSSGGDLLLASFEVPCHA